MRNDSMALGILFSLAIAGCGDGHAQPRELGSDDVGDAGKADGRSSGAGLGATIDRDAGTASFRLYSSKATRVELWIYGTAYGAAEVMRAPMTLDPTEHVWSIELDVDELESETGATIYYGYRAWGPNWTYDGGWKPGSSAGFQSDVDAAGNRFNPNKLLVDPYAIELSHDPITPDHVADGIDGTIYGTGPQHRTRDSGTYAPKAIAIEVPREDVGTRPERALRDEVIYEVHVRGLTMNDPEVPDELRGTYAGAAMKASYLKALGVTAIELLPIQESQNDTNDLLASTDGDNYWGYATLGYFAPDRRYAHDRSAGGPTRELQQMVAAFHAEGIKVYMDVVYNHTAEGGLWDGSGDVASILSWRGIDNTAYYETVGNGDQRHYWDNNGVGPNFRTADRAVRDLVVDSLRYYQGVVGIDGFRFDLASVLGNRCGEGCFSFDKLDPDNVLNRLVRELPARPADGGNGVDLIAEPWAIGDGTYQVGNFPSGWAEWNGKFRDTMRKHQNKLGVDPVTPGELATRIAGSSDLFGDDGRKPWHSINFLVAHDGLTMRDLYACNGKNNGQAWPFGPSDGGDDNDNAWDQGGDAAQQRQAARTGFALLMLSAGVPMLTGGDEFLRTQRCNNNAYNLDSIGNWIDWSQQDHDAAFWGFAQGMIALRAEHPALRPSRFFEGRDRDGDGLEDIRWLTDAGTKASGAYMGDASKHFLAWIVDGDEVGDSAKAIYVAYNGWSGKVTATLPPPTPGKSWWRVTDTAAWMEGQENFAPAGHEDHMDGSTYDLAGRSLLVLVER